MSYIGHTCPCGHACINHHNYLTNPSCKARSCKRPCATEPEARVKPTFERKGTAIERVVRPGDKLGLDGAGGGITTCDCEDCCALYAEITGEVIAA